MARKLDKYPLLLFIVVGDVSLTASICMHAVHVLIQIVVSLVSPLSFIVVGDVSLTASLCMHVVHAVIQIVGEAMAVENEISPDEGKDFGEKRRSQ